MSARLPGSRTGSGRRIRLLKIEDREQCGVRADAKRQREHDDGGETGRANGLAKAVAHIVRELVDEKSQPHARLLTRVLIAAIPARELQITELPKCFVCCRIRRHTLCDEVVDAHLEMRAQLFVHLDLNLGRGAAQIPERTLASRLHTSSITDDTACA
jgi:hypothetical protein